MADPTDSQLIEQALAGSSPAFAALLDRHYLTIYRIAFKWSGNQADAEDIAQEVCVKLASVLSTFDGRAAFSSWLYRVTLNVVRDHQRKCQRQKAKADAYAEVTQVSAPADQEMAATLGQMWQAVKGLPARQRDAVLLTSSENMTHGEAAAVMGCKESTVSWYLHEAKKALKDLLKDHGDG